MKSTVRPLENMWFCTELHAEESYLDDWLKNATPVAELICYINPEFHMKSRQRKVILSLKFKLPKITVFWYKLQKIKITFKDIYYILF